jgi:hypothetical protein
VVIANLGEGAKDALLVEGGTEVPVITNSVVGWWSGKSHMDGSVK